eukprot:CAMPEP_0119516974 /NCGR_PEP_ID=MMETSP1344-20130328/34011_1 /TAXON_ID=236787 /ORGANISM="Florenciella parvula, Strain CCMP2471" /LENGTH=51 /DNA_ID=CAMNT_0007554519 /DNA_START=9 /DNA_END=161 /DNA_ORIENTATION=+
MSKEDFRNSVAWTLMDEEGQLTHEWAADQRKLFCKLLKAHPVEIDVTTHNS